jgi:hypothetical protein
MNTTKTPAERIAGADAWHKARAEAALKDWYFLGMVCIDTGTLLLCDPCQAVEAADDWNEGTRGSVDDLCTVHDHLGLTVMTGVGDGFYPVEVRYEDVPGFGKRVAELRVTFLPHPAFGYPKVAS